MNQTLPRTGLASLLALVSVLFVATIAPPALSGQAAAKTTPVYRQATAPLDSRVKDLLARMTLEEKIGQMTQLEKGSVKPGDVKGLLLGSVLSGGGGSPGDNTTSGWADMVDGYQKEALATRLGIPVLYGVDAVHGHNNLQDATIFPHNIGLGAANDPELVRRIAEATALETAACGVLWNFAPCVAVARDPRWGRTYESFGQDPALVARLGAAYVSGYQGAKTGTARPAASVKHFLGDGGTVYGSSRTDSYLLDQGNTTGDETYLRQVLLPPYVAALKAGALTVMASYSSWNGEKLHGSKTLLTGLLKGELGFQGFVVSDWGGMDQVDRDYYQAVVRSVNAGVDMNMVPQKGREFIQAMKKAVDRQDIPMSRIDDAVSRILRVKFQLGLFEAPLANRALAARVRSPEHLALARQAAARSQVLLKNDGRLLPLQPTAKKIYVAGYAADDMGMQCGGWTIQWQGKSGDITAGTTLLQAIKNQAPGAEVIFDEFGEFDNPDRSTTCVLVLGEVPYAEGRGDTAELVLDSDNLDIWQQVKQRFDHVVLVLYSGRPVILDDLATGCDAILAAWLPGSEAAGVADVLFGAVKPSGKLPFAWPASLDQLPLERIISGGRKPLYPLGHGLVY